jgi:large subunit ribosomal protein L30
MANAKAKNVVHVRQVRSAIGYRHDQLETLRGLGLGRLGKTAELVDTPALRGMLRKVGHLIEVREDG